MNEGLFDIGDTQLQAGERPALMTPLQRQVIRDLFARLHVTDARRQFEVVAELTGVRIASVAELEIAPANVLIRQLEARVTSASRSTTGDAWADRDEDTWIDRL